MTQPQPRWRDRLFNRVEPRNGLEPHVEGNTAVLRLYDAIDSWGGEWGVSATEVAAALDALPAAVSELHLHINSPGGDVFEGIAILNQLRQHPTRLTVTVDGLAASAASFVAMAGDTVVMAPNAEMMVHDAWGFALGDAETMTRTAADLDRVSENIASIYAARSGTDGWRDVMRAETWFSADEAVAAGLADSVLQLPEREQQTADRVRAHFALSAFAHAGRAEAPPPTISPASQAGATAAAGSTYRKGGADVALTDGLRERLGFAQDADEATILAALDEALTEAAEPAPSTPPAGVVQVDAEVFASLQAGAAAGREALAEQRSATRNTLVQAAVADGRIAPSRAPAWLARLEADQGEADTLAALTPGLVPVAEIGRSDEGIAMTSDDVLYASIYPTPKAV